MGYSKPSAVDKWLKKENLILLAGWAKDGLVDAEIAEKMKVPFDTFTRWKVKYEAIGEAVREGKEVVDYKVENALLKRALGYKVVEQKIVYAPAPKKGESLVLRREETIKEVAPDPTSIAIWLNNRKPEQWKRNRDNFATLTDTDKNITVNIIQEGSKDNKRIIKKINGSKGNNKIIPKNTPEVLKNTPEVEIQGKLAKTKNIKDEWEGLE